MVRAVTREVRDLDRDINGILEPFHGSFNPSSQPETACALLVDHICMRRDKRCLLAYHRVRSDKLEELCWGGIDVLERQQPQGGREASGGGAGFGADVANSSSLSPEEEEYVRQYSDLLAAYKGQFTDIDLTGSLEPPRDLFIDVRVLKDAGEIQTEYGYVVAAYDLGMQLTFANQCHNLDKEQPVLCSPRRCRAFDCARLPATPQLMQQPSRFLCRPSGRSTWTQLKETPARCTHKMYLAFLKRHFDFAW